MRDATVPATAPYEAADAEWDRLLTDLERRIAEAERGDLAALEGWTPAEVALPASKAARAARLVDRQHDLAARLTTELADTRATERQVRRTRKIVTAEAAPVFFDRPL